MSKELDNENKSRRQVRAEEKIKSVKMKKIRLVVTAGVSVLIVLIIASVALFQYKKDDDIRTEINAAKTGDAKAQYDLALIYLENETKKDLKKSVKWMKKSADQGNAEAQYELSNMYIMGDGITQDEKKIFGISSKVSR